jgi:gamma-glutamyltranspeptidase / glutathione hydrolase
MLLNTTCVPSSLLTSPAATYSFPRSSDPHPYSPGATNVEGRVSPAVIKGLAELVHDVTPWPEWTGSAGSIGAVKVDHTTGVRHGGADPHRVAYAIGR